MLRVGHRKVRTHVPNDDCRPQHGGVMADVPIRDQSLRRVVQHLKEATPEVGEPSALDGSACNLLSGCGDHAAYGGGP
jgi:hypothetical protein